LRRAENVSGGYESGADIAWKRNGLAISDRHGALLYAIAQRHDRQRRGGGDRLAVAAARVIGVAVGDERAIDGARRIDPRVCRRDVEPHRFGLQPGKRGAHVRKQARGQRDGSVALAPDWIGITLSR